MKKLFKLVLVVALVIGVYAGCSKIPETSGGSNILPTGGSAGSANGQMVVETEKPVVYVSSVDQLPIEDLERFAAKFLAEAEATSDDDFMFYNDNYQYVGTYLYTRRSNSALAHQNILQIVVSYDMRRQDSGELFETYTTTMSFRDMTLNDDGALVLAYDNAIFGSMVIDEAHYSIQEVNVVIDQPGSETDVDTTGTETEAPETETPETAE